MSAPLLDCAGLHFAYPHRPETLRALDLQLAAGERLGLIGPNGAGKTTLFLLACGLLRPQAGEIRLLEQLVKPGEFRAEIGLVFQNPDDQLFCPCVRDDIAFGPENLGLTPAGVEQRVQEALTATGITPLAERIPHHLSGGEKCMVAIATILAMQPQLILFDEPSANLDLRARRRLIEFLQRAPQAYILSAHDLDLIRETCDRVVLLDQGKIVADGAPDTVMGDRELMLAHNLEVPLSLERSR
ncbi:MAG: ABC transporter ATP-binding protein [Spirulinaceae cyanobacterium SM2_1_0]|nr:ABC transporter ATP-binding protein [Spirulinaceae cyanobacterium SM2_1_0]